MPPDSNFRKLGGITPKLHWQRRYEQRLRKHVINPLFNDVAKTFAEALLFLPGQILTNDIVLSIRTALTRNVINLAETEAVVEEALNHMAHQHTMEVNRVFKRAVGVDIRPLLHDAQIRDYLRHRVKDNVDLIVTLGERHKEGLLKHLQDDLVNRPFDRESITQFLRKGNKSSGYNLRRIVRDQTNKVTGQLSYLRQSQLGIQYYEWSTSMDIRVRPTHRVLEGRVFRWDQPPAEGHPGEAIQCRCVALPMMSEEEAAKIKADADALDTSVYGNTPDSPPVDPPRLLQPSAPVPSAPAPPSSVSNVPTWQMPAKEHHDWAKKRIEELRQGPEYEAYQDLKNQLKDVKKRVDRLKEEIEADRKMFTAITDKRPWKRTLEEKAFLKQYFDSKDARIKSWNEDAHIASGLENKINIQSPATRLGLELKQRLLRPVGEEIEIPKVAVRKEVWMSKAKHAELQQVVDETLGEYRRLVNRWPPDDMKKRIRVNISNQPVRAFADEESRFITLGLDHVNDLRKFRATLVHELEHHREFAMRKHDGDMPGLRFLHQRTKGDPPRTMRDVTGNDAFDSDEITREDKFLAPYIGKLYREWNKSKFKNVDNPRKNRKRYVADPWGAENFVYTATEVQTMAIEKIFDPARYAGEKSLILDDFGFFAWILKNMLTQ